MSRVDRLLRPNVRNLEPYRSARDEFAGDDVLLLDANENAWGSGALARYPDPGQSDLKSAIARLRGIDRRRIFVGNGSDEAIDLLIRAYCAPESDEVVVMPPTYGMYEVAASVNDVPVLNAPLDDDFQIDWDAFRRVLSPRTHIVFLCSPNNPTGNCLDPLDVERLVAYFDGLVVLDEAYIDFAPRRSWLPRLSEFDNLVVLQTLSKAWGLASIRVGMAFAAPEIVDVMTRIKPPYNVSGLSQAVALEQLANRRAMERTVGEIVRERNRLVARLEQLDAVERVYPSDANFLLVRVTNAERVYRHLADRGVVVRDRSSLPNCENCLRITVGTPEQNAQLIAGLETYREAAR